MLRNLRRTVQLVGPFASKAISPNSGMKECSRNKLRKVNIIINSVLTVISRISVHLHEKFPCSLSYTEMSITWEG